jgi:hypothetical protein
MLNKAYGKVRLGLKDLAAYLTDNHLHAAVHETKSLIKKLEKLE